MDDDMLSRRRAEVASKVAQVREVLARRGLDAAYLSTIANTAWLSAGAATYVDESVDAAACGMLVTDSDVYLLTDPIEAPRLTDEERLDALGFTLVIEPWHSRGEFLSKRAAAGRVGADIAAPGEDASLVPNLVRLRSQLCPDEQERMRAGGRLAAQAMSESIQALRPGMTEHAAAAAVAAASRTLGGTPTVVLVASDERIARYRHPLPTMRAIERHVMLVLCFRYRGLVTALTRIAYFGAIPDELRHVTDAVARVDGAVISGTREGRTLGDMYEILREAYQQEGAPEAIEQHHQGGTIAYLARETFARPGSTEAIVLGQAFAWNPSMRGAKSEDTFILTELGPEIVTATPSWPMLQTPSGVARPDILSLDL